MCHGPPSLILVAMTAEASPLLRQLSLRRDTGRPWIWRGVTDGGHTVLAVMGVGAERACRTAEHLIAAEHPRAVWIAGFAGATCPTLRTADVLVPAEVRDVRDRSALRPTVPTETSGVLMSVEAPRTADKTALWRERGVDAVDMETAAVARLCHCLQVPWAAVRAISDTATSPLPATVGDLVRPDGRPDGWAVARLLLRRPSTTIPLRRLATASRRAGRALAVAVQSRCGDAGRNPL